VSFFAYPHLASSLVPEGCDVVELAGLDVDVPDALESLAAALDAPAVAPSRELPPLPSRPTGALDTRTLADAIGSLLPEGCVVVDESNTSGVGLLERRRTSGSPCPAGRSATGSPLRWAPRSDRDGASCAWSPTGR
jgi:acetolactate synthase-1/2/3 large subunit